MAGSRSLLCDGDVYVGERRSETAAVQISRLLSYLSGLSPLLLVSVSAISELGSGLSRMLSKFGLGSLKRLETPQLLANGADSGAPTVSGGLAKGFG
jgi:hypothetical protein